MSIGFIIMLTIVLAGCAVFQAEMMVTKKGEASPKSDNTAGPLWNAPMELVPKVTGYRLTL